MAKGRDVGAIIISILTGLLAIWWLLMVQTRLGKLPTIQGGVVVLDEFQRAKDILIVVFPLFSASVAYWLGRREVGEAKEEAANVRLKLEAVLEQGPSDLLSKAKTHHPNVFKDYR